MMRRIAAGLLFAALVAAGTRLPLLRLLLPPHRPPDTPAPAGGLHRWPLRFANDPTPPELLRFFEGLRAQTRPGERVAILMAPPYQGFGYAYWRASYELAGRKVLLPVDVAEPDEADAIAVWSTNYGRPQFDLVWMEGKGALLRRKP